MLDRNAPFTRINIHYTNGTYSTITPSYVRDEIARGDRFGYEVDRVSVRQYATNPNDRSK